MELHVSFRTSRMTFTKWEFSKTSSLRKPTVLSKELNSEIRREVFVIWLVSPASSSMRGSLQSRLERNSWASPILLVWDKAALVDTQPIHLLVTQLLHPQVLISIKALGAKISPSSGSTIRTNLALEELMTLIPWLKAPNHNLRFLEWKKKRKKMESWDKMTLTTQIVMNHLLTVTILKLRRRRKRSKRRKPLRRLSLRLKKLLRRKQHSLSQWLLQHWVDWV